MCAARSEIAYASLNFAVLAVSYCKHNYLVVVFFVRLCAHTVLKQQLCGKRALEKGERERGCESKTLRRCDKNDADMIELLNGLTHTETRTA